VHRLSRRLCVLGWVMQWVLRSCRLLMMLWWLGCWQVLLTLDKDRIVVCWAFRTARVHILAVFRIGRYWECWTWILTMEGLLAATPYHRMPPRLQVPGDRLVRRQYPPYLKIDLHTWTATTMTWRILCVIFWITWTSEASDFKIEYVFTN